MKAAQADLFTVSTPGMDGLRYSAELIDMAAEAALIDKIGDLPFRAFEFQGFLGKRRTVSFGMHYDFNGHGLGAADPIPDWLLPTRRHAAAFAGVAEDLLQHVLVTEYAPGAGIGWHRDRPVFGRVIGISLLAPARLRFRRRDGDRWQRAVMLLEPRSAYLLSGPARRDWEHSIAPMEALRYSLTFRSLRSKDQL